MFLPIFYINGSYQEETAYIMGDTGRDECPDGYEEIYDGLHCKIASYFLNLPYSGPTNIGNSNSICNWCGGCNPELVKMSNNHAQLAKWICRKGMSLEIL